MIVILKYNNKDYLCLFIASYQQWLLYVELSTGVLLFRSTRNIERITDNKILFDRIKGKTNQFAHEYVIHTEIIQKLITEI